MSLILHQINQRMNGGTVNKWSLVFCLRGALGETFGLVPEGTKVSRGRLALTAGVREQPIPTSKILTRLEKNTPHLAGHNKI
jgi:hypothetical protein